MTLKSINYKFDCSQNKHQEQQGLHSKNQHNNTENMLFYSWNKTKGRETETRCRPTLALTWQSTKQQKFVYVHLHKIFDGSVHIANKVHATHTYAFLPAQLCSENETRKTGSIQYCFVSQVNRKNDFLNVPSRLPIKSQTRNNSQVIFHLCLVILPKQSISWPLEWFKSVVPAQVPLDTISPRAKNWPKSSYWIKKLIRWMLDFCNRIRMRTDRRPLLSVHDLCSQSI